MVRAHGWVLICSGMIMTESASTAPKSPKSSTTIV